MIETANYFGYFLSDETDYDFDDESLTVPAEPLHFPLESHVHLGEGILGTEYWGGDGAFIYADYLFNNNGTLREYISDLYLSGFSYSEGNIYTKISPDGSWTSVTDSTVSTSGNRYSEVFPEEEAWATLITGERILLFNDTYGRIELLQQVVAVHKSEFGSLPPDDEIDETIVDQFEDLFSVATPVDQTVTTD
jgi:hypothetical protein